MSGKSSRTKLLSGVGNSKELETVGLKRRSVISNFAIPTRGKITASNEKIKRNLLILSKFFLTLFINIKKKTGSVSHGNNTLTSFSTEINFKR